MTTVTFKYHNGYIYGVKLEGHAGFNIQGPDILCASLSMASMMVCNQVAEECDCPVRYDVEDRTGLLNFELSKKTHSMYPRVIPLFHCLKNAVLDLFSNPEYRDFICIKEER